MSVLSVAESSGIQEVVVEIRVRLANMHMRRFILLLRATSHGVFQGVQLIRTYASLTPLPFTSNSSKPLYLIASKEVTLWTLEDTPSATALINME
jgi:hypothetical protein